MIDLEKKPDDDFIQSDNIQDIQQTFVASAENQSTEKPSGFAIVGLVCGILSLVCCCAWYLSGILGILGLVFSIMVLVKKLPGKSFAIAGAICAAIGVAIAIFVMILGLLAGRYYSSMSSDHLHRLIDMLDEMH